MGLLNLSTYFPKLTIGFLLITSVYFGIQLPNLKIDNSVESLLVKTDEDYLFYLETKKRFGSDKISTLIFKDKDLFSKDKLIFLQKLVYELEIWPEIEKIDSLFTTTNLESRSGGLETAPLLEEIPSLGPELEDIQPRALRNPYFQKNLLSNDASLLSFNIFLSNDLSTTDEVLFAKKLHLKINQLQKKFETIFVIGKPEITRKLELGVKEDITFIVPFAILVVVLLLYLTMGNIWSALFPIITGALSVVWTFGQMALLDIPLQVLTMGIPVLLIVIGSTEDTHIISEYEEALAKKRNIADLALNYLSQKITLPIILTTLTTIVGFGSIMANEIKLLIDFGQACMFGLLFNFIITISLSPILLKYCYKKRNVDTIKESSSHQFFENFSKLIFTTISKYKKLLLIFFMSMACVFIYYSSKVKTNNSFLSMLRENDPILRNINLTDSKIGGIYTLFLTLKAPNDKDFKDHHLIEKVLQIEGLPNKFEQIISAQSYAGLIALINREFTDQKASSYLIPKNNNLIAQYILFLSPDDLQNYVTSDYKHANVIFRHNISSTSDTSNLLKSMHTEISNILRDSGIEFRFTGSRVLTDKAATTIVNSQISSITIISISVFLLILFIYRDFKIAFFSLIPNLYPIIFLFGFMGLFDIYLDVGTCNVAAVAIGIAADDTLHFLSRMEQNIKISFNKMLAISQTLKDELRPISCTSFSLSIGLAMLGFSTFSPLMKFGLLISLVIFIAYIADIFLTPSLLSFINEDKFVNLVEVFRYRISPLALKNSPLFQKIDIKTARHMILSGKIIEYEKTYVFPKRLMQENLLFIIQGHVQISRAGGRAQESVEKIIIKELSPGGTFGQLTRELSSSTDYNAQAINHCKLLIVNRKFLERLKNNFPDEAHIMAQNVSGLHSPVELI